MPRFDNAMPDATTASRTGRPAPILRRLGLLGVVLLLGLLLLPVSARADNKNVAKGKKLYADDGCATCHGADGREPLLSEYPIIAGQSADYLYNALRAYKDGDRKGRSTTGHFQVFKSLNDTNFHALADYIATMK